MIVEGSLFVILMDNFYSVAVIYLPIKIIKTAGTSIPISGTNTEGSQLATMSVDIIHIINIKYSK